MLKKGQATVYASAGAEYGPWTFDHLKDLEDKARGKKLGVWGARGFERPEDYKKRYRVGEGEDGK
jgi:endonuclease YncB( thermonuclease family)